jgi:hypothetical protein
MRLHFYLKLLNSKPLQICDFISQDANGSALKDASTSSKSLDTPGESSLPLLLAGSCQAPGALAHSTTIRPCFCAAEELR